jgi:hypothetical protein
MTARYPLNKRVSVYDGATWRPATVREQRDDSILVDSSAGTFYWCRRIWAEQLDECVRSIGEVA